MKMKKTERGFNYSRFEDRYGATCSLQKSSIATEDCIWLGIDDPDPKIMARDARALGIQTDETVGWISYPLPEEVMVTTRMHLSQDNVRDLLPYLIRFAETGDL